MKREKVEQNEYDSVFDFLFKVQKSKVNRAFPKKPDEMGTYSSALVDIGTQPTIYPLESSFRTINKYIEKATEIDLGGGVTAGLGSDAFSSPDKFSQKNISRDRATSSWARIGGSLHYGIDGALISLFAKNNGASSKVAYGAGVLFSDLLKEEIAHGDRDFWGFQTDEEIAEKEKVFFQRGVDLRATSLARSNPRLDKAWILKNIQEGQNVASKTERIRNTAELLRMQGIDPKEGLEVAYSIWGDPKSEDLGAYRTATDPLKEKLQPLSSDKVKLARVRKSLTLTDERQKKNEIYKILKNEYGMDPKAAMIMSAEICELKQNNGMDIARDSIYFSLAGDITSNLTARGDYSRIPKVKARIREVLEPNGKATWGMKAARAVTLTNWLSSSGAWGSTLLDGNWEKFGVDDFNFTKIVKAVEVKKDGEKTGKKYYVGADSVIGRLIGDSYYLHPNNLIKGLFFEGDLWLKWACNAKGELNSKSFAYFMYNMRLNNFFSTMAKPFQGLSSNFLKILNPIAKGVNTFVKNLLKRVIGATGLAGIVINMLMNVVSEKVLYVLNQIMIAIMLGFIGLLFILLESTGVLYSDEKVESMMGSQVVEIEDTGVFEQEDFEFGE